MKSLTKGIVHTLATLLSFYLPTLISSSHTFELTIGSVIAIALNWVASHTIPTTNGASANQ